MSAPQEYDYEDKFVEALKKVESNSLKAKLVMIRNLVVKRLALEKEFKSTHYKLEAKYEALYKPIYEKRSKVIEGTSEVTADDIKDQMSNLTLSDQNAPNAEKGVPQFWLKALKNTTQFSHDINDKDKEVLSHLKDITVDFQETGSFKLNFLFALRTHQVLWHFCKKLFGFLRSEVAF